MMRNLANGDGIPYRGRQALYETRWNTGKDAAAMIRDLEDLALVKLDWNKLGAFQLNWTFVREGMEYDPEEPTLRAMYYRQNKDCPLLNAEV